MIPFDFSEAVLQIRTLDLDENTINSCAKGKREQIWFNFVILEQTRECNVVPPVLSIAYTVSSRIRLGPRHVIGRLVQTVPLRATLPRNWASHNGLY